MWTQRSVYEKKKTLLKNQCHKHRQATLQQFKNELKLLGKLKAIVKSFLQPLVKYQNCGNMTIQCFHLAVKPLRSLDAF